MPEQLSELGIRRQRAPGQTAMHELLCRLPAAEIEKALGDWIGEFASLQPRRQIVPDSKTLRASAGSEYPALHLLAAYCPQVDGVLAPLPVEGKDNKITAAKTMLKTLPVKGTVVTGDALFCQRELCRTIDLFGNPDRRSIRERKAGKGLKNAAVGIFHNPGRLPATPNQRPRRVSEEL